MKRSEFYAYLGLIIVLIFLDAMLFASGQVTLRESFDFVGGWAFIIVAFLTSLGFFLWFSKKHGYSKATVYALTLLILIFSAVPWTLILFIMAFSHMIT